MEKQCRAKDPSTCRMHGSPDRALPVSEIKDNAHLSEMADHARISGDFELFVDCKAQMDKNAREVLLAPASEKTEISKEAAAIGAKARWKDGTNGGQWRDLSHVRRNEAIKLEQDVLAEALPYMPDGKITEGAVEAMAIYRYHAVVGSGWNRLTPRTRDELREYSRASLEAAAPHLGISVNAKASIRNLFRNMGTSFTETKETVEGTVHAGIEEISEHHEQEIPPEIGGSTVAWSDMNPFKSPFKNGRLR